MINMTYVGQLNNLKHVFRKEKSYKNIYSRKVYNIASKLKVFSPVLTFSAGGFLLTLMLPESGAETGACEGGGSENHLIKSDVTLASG